MQAALKEFLILPPTPENKALFLSQWPLASLFGAITETGDKLNDLIVRQNLISICRFFFASQSPPLRRSRHSIACLKASRVSTFCRWQRWALALF
jgi:hypothetical protein